MPINLAVPIVFPNGSRLVITAVRPDEDAQVMSIELQLRTPQATNLVASEVALNVRNGRTPTNLGTDQVSRGTLNPNGLFSHAILFSQGVLTLPTGFDDALAAWKAPATAAARKSALEQWCLLSQVIHPSLTGS